MEKQIVNKVIISTFIVIVMIGSLFFILQERIEFKPTSLILYSQLDITSEGKYFIESFFLFVYSNLICIVIIVLSNKGYPFKQSFYTNPYLLFLIVANSIFFTIALIENYLPYDFTRGFVVDWLRVPDVSPEFLNYFIFFLVVSSLVLIITDKIQNAYYFKKELRKVSEAKFMEETATDISVVSKY